MATLKRKSDEASGEQLYSNKSRSKPSEGRVDPIFGQRSALPGLDDDFPVEADNDGLNYDDGEDESSALAYLRAVRQEATSIPHILVASAFTKQDVDYNDGGAYYEDGAYFASDLIAENEVVEGGFDYEEPDPRLEYYDSILMRYESLRDILQKTPPEDAVESLDADHPTSLGRLETKVVRWWRWKMRTTNPLPVQVASMTKETVLRLLGLATTGALLSRGAEVEIGVSAWVWALLARLPDRGELNSEEIGVVRDLGKKAVLVGMGLKKKAEWEEGMDEFEAEYDDAVTEGGDNGNGSVANFTPSDNLSRTLIGPQLPETEIPKYEEPGGPQAETSQDRNQPEDFAAAKTRLLDRLASSAVQESTSHVTVAFDDYAFEDSPLGPPALQPSDTAERKDLVKLRPEPDPSSCMKAAKAQKKVEPTSDSSRWNTKATVDMIITIAGEMYGQRDLLEFRSVWADA